MFDKLKGKFKSRKKSSKKSKQADEDPKVSFSKGWKDIKQSATNATRRFHIGSHRGMEHKRDQFFIAIFIAIIGIGAADVNYHHYMTRQSETLTSYASKVSFSHTNSVSMKLHKIYQSKNGRTAYVPFTFDSTDGIPTNANQYTVSVGGALGHMKQPMSGQMVLFGDTTRGTFILHSAHRISNQPIEVILRNNEKLNPDNSNNQVQPSASDAGIQQYERKYDALDFKINPGSEKVKRKSALGTDDSLTTLYKTLYAKNDLSVVQSADKASVKQERHDVKVARYYTKQLQKFGFRVPNPPKFMRPNWRPNNYIRKDGVPANKPDTKQNRTTANTDIANPINDIEGETPEPPTYPSDLKKKDGTTTSDASSNQVQSKDSNEANDDDSGTQGSHINGGSSNDPSEMWTSLQQAWNDIMSLKYNIFTINAEENFKIHVVIRQINNITSVGDKKHFHQVN